MKSEVLFLWNRFTMREGLLLGFCATFIVLTKAMLRMKLHISGHSMFFFLFFLLLSRGCVRKTGAATLVGLLSGGMSIALGMGGRDPLVILNFILPALVVDFAGIIYPEMPSSYPACMLVGGIAASFKGVGPAIIEKLAGAPLKIIFMKAVIKEALPAVVFGILGSLPVPAVIRKLQRNRLIPSPGEKK